ncbi:PREDICTED: zinc finger protein OZF-like isoform X1 [Cyprinodon variegatus]|uniref:zinc finger protein OZF-like isoform X1 n=1 Tax=Cyprinodon variegatus TaxID=28743 RepID=UPI00074264CC|nr:PREDICTED: zinc finger protein OZF-like isoform X1 [Cyprinodon variegatus]
MGSVQPLREFIRQRLTAAAEEIFSEVEKTIIQYEEEINRQRLLDISWRPRISSQSADSTYPPHSVCKEEDPPAELQPCSQERSSSWDQQQTEEHLQIKKEVKEPEASEALLVKEKPSELCNSQDGQALPQKQDIHTSFINTVYKEQPESDREQILSQDIPTDGNRFWEGRNDEDFGLITEEEGPQTQRGLESRDQTFFLAHMQTPTSERSFSCPICGKYFPQRGFLRVHLKIHSDKSLCQGQICTKGFLSSRDLPDHMNTHTGEKVFTCSICGKSFSAKGTLNVHLRIHTGEKPFTCQTCGKSFVVRGHLTDHSRTHTGEKPFSCQTCGKCFSQSTHLRVHSRVHSSNRQLTGR